MGSVLPFTKVTRYLELDTTLISFTGRLFYQCMAPKVEKTPAMQAIEQDGWVMTALSPVARFGAYVPDQESMSHYAEEYGKTGADPLLGVVAYPYYHVLVDTGIVAVRGLVGYLHHSTSPDHVVHVWLRDAADQHPPAAR